MDYYLALQKYLHCKSTCCSSGLAKLYFGLLPLQRVGNIKINRTIPAGAGAGGHEQKQNCSTRPRFPLIPYFLFVTADTLNSINLHKNESLNV